MIRTLCLLLLTTMIQISSPNVWADKVNTPDLTGIWKGKVEAGISRGLHGHEKPVLTPTFGNYDITFTFHIKKQEGRAILGVWSSPNYSETVMGVLKRNRTHLSLVDEDSYYDGQILEDGVMELCLRETHMQASGVWCLLMKKQK